jgi:hypothetical protein
LIGLKVDLTISRTVDPTLGHLIGNLFNVEAIESDTRSLSGVQLLQKCFFQFIDLETKRSSRLSIHHQQNYETDPKEYIM